MESREPVAQDAPAKPKECLPGVVAESERMEKVAEGVRLAAKSNATVLVVGETGTGKELIARAIHILSSRNAGPFVAVNCGAIPDTLLESELFGHEKGAFTGANALKFGVWERAHGGTFLLDEVGELSLLAQAKILRVLQEKAFMHVGGTRPINVDARVVAATNKNLRQMINEGRFRLDLYYRLNVMLIWVPPLRDRREDIPVLVRHFASLNEVGTGSLPEFDALALQRLARHDWPGNVRELENILMRAMALNPDAPVITDAHIEAVLGGEEWPQNHVFLREQRPPTLERGLKRSEEGKLSIVIREDATFHEAVENIERYLIEEAFRKHGGNLTQAAEALKMSPRTLRSKAGKLGFRPVKGIIGIWEKIPG